MTETISSLSKAYDDTIAGDLGDDQLYGGDGNDTIFGTLVQYLDDYSDYYESAPYEGWEEDYGETDNDQIWGGVMARIPSMTAGAMM